MIHTKLLFFIYKRNEPYIYIHISMHRMEIR